jgi:allantoinase
MRSSAAIPAIPASGHFAYSAIQQRPAFTWSAGKRLAVYIGFKLEHFAFGEGLGTGIGPASPQP